MIYIYWILSAEMPNTGKNDHPRLYEIVKSCMFHGPCGHLRPESVCMEDNICTKGDPKEYCDSTIELVDGYPKYQRRDSEMGSDATKLLYTDVPVHYTFDNQSRKWKKQLRGSDKVISRIYDISPNNSELYYLHIVLLCTPRYTMA